MLRPSPPRLASRLLAAVDRLRMTQAAALVVASHVMLFLVQGVWHSGEPPNVIPVGLAVAHALWPDGMVDRVQYWPLGAVIFVALGVVPVLLAYGIAIRIAARDAAPTRRALRTVIVATALACIPLALLPRMLSGDLLSYIAYGRLGPIYGANPFLDAPQTHPDGFTERITFIQFRYLVSAYGPVWTGFSSILTRVVEALGGAPWLYALAYKAAAAGAHVACVWLVWNVLESVRPSWQLAGTVGYAWNPLALAETAWNGHNDVFVLALLLAAALAYARGRPRLGLVPLALSIPIKWITAPCMPLYALAVAREAPSRRRGAFDLVLAAVVSVAVLALSYAPYWKGPQTLDHIAHAPSNHYTTNSLVDEVLTEARRATRRESDPRADDVIAPTMAPMLAAWEPTHRLDWSRMAPRPHERLERNLRYLAFAIFAATWLYWAVRVRDLSSMLRSWYWTLFVYVSVAAVWFWPWYLVWCGGVAVVTGSRRAAMSALVLSLAGATMYFHALFGPPAHRIHALLVFGPAFVYLAWNRRESIAS